MKSRVKRMGAAKPTKEKLSLIFGNLPDMLKQQVLEFVGFHENEPFILNYVVKSKRVCKIVNPVFMKQVLEFKLQNPPKYLLVKDKKGRDVTEKITIVTPPKIQSYTIVKSIVTKTYDVEYHYKYIILIREYIDINKILNDICRRTPLPINNEIRSTTKDIYHKMCFCDPKSKMMARKRL
jgi:hypothetical protein